MLALNFNPFPRLETQRCILGRLEITDAPKVFVFRSDKRMLEYIDIPKANSLKDAEDYIKELIMVLLKMNGYYRVFSLKILQYLQVLYAFGM